MAIITKGTANVSHFMLLLYSLESVINLSSPKSRADIVSLTAAGGHRNRGGSTRTKKKTMIKAESRANSEGVPGLEMGRSDSGLMLAVVCRKKKMGTGVAANPEGSVVEGAPLGEKRTLCSFIITVTRCLSEASSALYSPQVCADNHLDDGWLDA